MIDFMKNICPSENSNSKVYVYHPDISLKEMEVDWINPP